MKYALIALIVMSGVFASLFIVRKTIRDNEILRNHSLPPVVEQPDPFYDMTIPYLRSRQYTSSLGEKTLYQNKGSYTSYLTSYNSDGLKIHGLLTVPQGKTPVGGWPAIVFVHGYIAPTIYKTTERYVDYVDYLARSGFVVFKIDLRGHGDSEGTPSGAYYSSDYVIDTLNAYAALSNSDFVDKARIGLWGHSMAGNITLRAFVVRPDIPAVVIWAGAGYSYTDLLQYGLHDNSYRPQSTTNIQSKKREQLMHDHGEPMQTNSFWQTVAPTHYLNDLKGALELHQAKDDPVVSIHYNEDLNSLLDKTSVPHKFFEYETGGHNISGSSFNVAMMRTVTFFKQYLRK